MSKYHYMIFSGYELNKRCFVFVLLIHLRDSFSKAILLKEMQEHQSISIMHTYPIRGSWFPRYINENVYGRKCLSL